jgi:hypothetical protein
MKNLTEVTKQSDTIFQLPFIPTIFSDNQPKGGAGVRGAQYLMGENLRVVWAEVSTLS